MHQSSLDQKSDNDLESLLKTAMDELASGRRELEALVERGLGQPEEKVVDLRQEPAKPAPG